MLGIGRDKGCEGRIGGAHQGGHSLFHTEGREPQAGEAHLAKLGLLVGTGCQRVAHISLRPELSVVRFTMSHTISLRPVLAGGRNVAFELAIKRVMDICVSAFLLVALSPLLLIVALLVRLTSPGPVFHTCDWIGHEGRPFRGWKFRTMIANADSMEAELRSQNEMTGPAFKITNDPRVTPVGRILRRYSIDELPQLWNVLRGDISLVGPGATGTRIRPVHGLPEAEAGGQAGHYLFVAGPGRHRISDYDRWVELDLEYIATWSLWLDIRILARTALVVVQGTGV